MKKIFISFVLILLFFGLFLADSPKIALGGYCIGVDGQPITIPGLGTIEWGVNLGDRCRSLGGSMQSYLPQYVGPGRVNSPITVDNFLETLARLVQIFQAIFWILMIGFGLYAAYLYLFAAGNPEKARDARRALIYTVIAGIIAVLSYSIPAFVDAIFR